MGVSARTEYILLSSLVLVALAALITGLTVGLRTPPPPNGGSPIDPPLINATDETTAAGPPPTTTTTTTTSSPASSTATTSPPTTPPTTTPVVLISSSTDFMTSEATDVSSSNPGPPPSVVPPPVNLHSKQEQKDTLDNDIDEYRERLPDAPWPDSVTRSYSTAVVTTDTVPCSPIGRDILAAGGSAVDAAIAASACVGVVNHHSCGIGGGHFMVIYEKPRGGDTRELVTIQAREWAPIAAFQDMFKNNSDAARKGGLAIGVPGDVKGFYAAWERYGVLPWSDLFQPAIQLCEQGFTVERSLSSAIGQYEDDIRADPNLSELFVKPGGELVTEGDLLQNPKLATTLSRIADDPHTYYNGSLADDIVADIADYDGIITNEDLLAYRAKIKEAIQTPLSNGGYTVYSVTPPSSGIVYQFIMNIVNGYEFSPVDIGGIDEQILTYHRIIEANKFAYAKRSNLGDEDFVDVQELLANLSSPIYAEGIRAQINDSSTQGWQYYGPDFDIPADSGTAHLSLQTRDGSAVALTSTINLFFGSNVRGSRTGIMFNDEMDDFSIPGTSNSFGVPASPANYIVPGKQPMSSMCPSLILDSQGNIVFSSGAAGGTRITTATAFVTMQALWFNEPLHNATDTPRVHHQLIPEDVKYEPHLHQELIDGFVNKNHQVTNYGSIAVVNSIHNSCTESSLPDDACLHATSDGRKGGAPDGIS